MLCNGRMYAVGSIWLLMGLGCGVNLTRASEPGITRPAANQQSRNRSESPVANSLDDLSRHWLETMEALHIPGLAVAVIHDDKVILLETLGARDPHGNAPVTKDTYFYIASCTKAFTGMALLSLTEGGAVAWDAPVKKYLRRFELADAKATQEIAVGELLSHAAGIESDPIVFLDAFTGDITEDRYYRHLRNVYPTREFAYSNVHYTLAGRIIEAVSGTPWQQAVAQYVLRPAGLTRTTCSAGVMFGDKDVAVPCVYSQGRIQLAVTRKSDRTMHAAGGMASSISDMARWLTLFLNGGELDGNHIIDREIIERMTTAQSTRQQSRSPIPNAVRTGYGVGWNIGAYRGRRILEHGGGFVGAAAHLAILPDERIAIAVLSNASTPLPMVVISDVLDQLLGEKRVDLIPRLAQAATHAWAQQNKQLVDLGRNPADDPQWLSAPVSKYVGTYENDDWGTITVVVKDGKLGLRTGEMPWSVGSKEKDRLNLLSESGSSRTAKFVFDGPRVAHLEVEVSDDQTVRYTRTK